MSRYPVLEDKLGGKGGLDLMSMDGVRVPTDYDIESVFGDIIMLKIVDQNEFGEVLRDGIYVKQDYVHKMWRVGEVVKKGPRCSSEIEIGMTVMYPSDRGISMIGRGSEQFVFINEERLFAKVRNI